jgi:hypothetical protein
MPSNPRCERVCLLTARSGEKLGGTAPHPSDDPVEAVGHVARRDPGRMGGFLRGVYRHLPRLAATPRAALRIQPVDQRSAERRTSQPGSDLHRRSSLTRSGMECHLLSSDGRPNSLRSSALAFRMACFREAGRFRPARFS